MPTVLLIGHSSSTAVLTPLLMPSGLLLAVAAQLVEVEVGVLLMDLAVGLVLKLVQRDVPVPFALDVLGAPLPRAAIQPIAAGTAKGKVMAATVRHCTAER